MKYKDKKLVQSPFMGNYFCLVPNTDMAFVIIAKNACTFLKKVAWYNLTGFWIQENTEIHDLIGYRPEKSGFLMSFRQIREAERKRNRPYKKFAVWRDPVDRVISAYKHFCLEGTVRYYFIYLNLHLDTSFDRFVEFVEFELKKSNLLFIDEHVRKQVDYYSSSNVDEIVHIRDLDSFLEGNGVKFKRERSNRTRSVFKSNDDRHLEKIRNWYADDYDIIPTFGKCTN